VHLLGFPERSNLAWSIETKNKELQQIEEKIQILEVCPKSRSKKKVSKWHRKLKMGAKKSAYFFKVLDIWVVDGKKVSFG
jgi:hypothetical protein